MKINVIPVINDHFQTLRDARSGKYSKFDFFIFYVIPIVCGIAPLFWCIRFESSFYNISVTFFGIFIALLLNVQVAIFGIFQRKWDIPDDARLVEIQNEKLEERRVLLGELNSNLSYMTLVSCLALIAFLAFFVFDFGVIIMASITCVFYAHFILTLMMTVKRAHTLFQMEYDGHC